MSELRNQPNDKQDVNDVKVDQADGGLFLQTMKDGGTVTASNQAKRNDYVAPVPPVKIDNEGFTFSCEKPSENTASNQAKRNDYKPTGKETSPDGFGK